MVAGLSVPRARSRASRTSRLGDLDEHEQGVGDLPADLEAPLDVDDQDDAGPLLHRPADRAGRRAVVMVVDHGGLEQFAAGLLELLRA